MIELKGSDKQIAWAEKIRKELIDIVRDMEDKKDEVINFSDATIKEKLEKSYNKMMIAAKETIENETSSKFYIENVRDDMTNKVTLHFTRIGRFFEAYRKYISE